MSFKQFLQRAVDGAFGPHAADVTVRAVKLYETQNRRPLGVRLRGTRGARLHETAAPGRRVDVSRMSGAQIAQHIRRSSAARTMATVGAPME